MVSQSLVNIYKPLPNLLVSAIKENQKKKSLLLKLQFPDMAKDV